MTTIKRFSMFLLCAVAVFAQAYHPSTNTRVRAFWQPFEDSTELRQHVAVEMPPLPGYPSGFKAIVPSDVVTIAESDSTITLVLRKGQYVISDPKPQPPKPKADDFVPEYRDVMLRFNQNPIAAIPALIALQSKIEAAGLTFGAVAAAAGGTGK